MNKHSYRGFDRIKNVISQIFGVTGLLFFTLFTIFSIVAGLSNIPYSSGSILNDPRMTLVCFMTFFLFISIVIFSIPLNYLPTIWINENGLIISVFIFFQIRIPWLEIIDIGAGTPPRGYTLIRAQRITIFHFIYGWLYSRSFYPSFLIGKGIIDRDNLIKEIQQKIQRQTPQDIS